MLRKAVVAGQFYPRDKTELKKFVDKVLSKKKENILAGIVPHAGYIFSGKLAGQVIGMIGKKKTFIILGVNHSGIGGKLSFSLADFETPLGVVKNNVELGEKIMEKIGGEISEQAHFHEHSIEVELPFLQVSQKKMDIVPILLKQLSYEECVEIAKVSSKFVREDVCILVSSDFTHYGFNYGFVPFSENVKKNLYNLDKEIIDKILELNSKAVYEKAGKSTVCGILGITILTEIAKIKKWRGRLVDYYCSGDIIGDWSNSVGYAGLIFS